jgi:hypothetical protein
MCGWLRTGSGKLHECSLLVTKHSQELQAIEVDIEKKRLELKQLQLKLTAYSDGRSVIRLHEVTLCSTISSIR